jgi:hypothetical protein
MDRRAIKIDPYNRDAKIVYLQNPPVIVTANKEIIECAKAYGVSHDDWLLFLDLVHEKRPDSRLPVMSSMNVQLIMKRVKMQNNYVSSW